MVRTCEIYQGGVVIVLPMSRFINQIDLCFSLCSGINNCANFSRTNDSLDNVLCIFFDPVFFSGHAVFFWWWYAEHQSQ